MASARARGLVALCSKRAAGSSTESCLLSDPEISQVNENLSTPLSSWSDDVYDASDVKTHMCKIPRLIDVRRKLSFSPSRVAASNVFNANNTIKAAFAPLSLNAGDRDLKTAIYSQLIDASCSSITDKVAVADVNNATSTQEEYATLSLNTENRVLNTATDSDLKNASCCKVPASHNGSKPLYPSQLKIQEATRALNSGKEHVNTTGKIKKARALQTPCKLECKRCAHPRITEEERCALFKDFWELENHEKQWLYLYESIELHVPKRKSAGKGTKGEKLQSREYYFSVSKRKVKVCKTMFKSTLNICDSWIVSALSHCFDGQVVSKDNRGKLKSILKT